MEKAYQSLQSVAKNVSHVAVARTMCRDAGTSVGQGGTKKIEGNGKL